MRAALKFAIYRSGQTQRAVSLEARIPEGRLSEIVRGKAQPTQAERQALNQVLGRDYIAKEDNG